MPKDKPDNETPEADPQPKPGEAGYDWSQHYDTDNL